MVPIKQGINTIKNIEINFEASINSFNKKLDDFSKSMSDLKPTTIKTLAKKITG